MRRRIDLHLVYFATKKPIKFMLPIPLCHTTSTDAIDFTPLAYRHPEASSFGVELDIEVPTVLCVA